MARYILRNIGKYTASEYRHIFATFASWFLTFSSGATHRRIVERALTRIRNQQTTSAFFGWQGRTAGRKKLRHCAAQCLHRMRYQKLHQSFDSWVTFVRQVVETRTVLKRWLAKRCQKAVVCAFDVWKCVLASKKDLLTRVTKEWCRVAKKGAEEWQFHLKQSASDAMHAQHVNSLQTQNSETVARLDQKLQEVHRVNATKQASLREHEADLARALQTGKLLAEKVESVSVAQHDTIQAVRNLCRAEHTQHIKTLSSEHEEEVGRLEATSEAKLRESTKRSTVAQKHFERTVDGLQAELKLRVNFEQQLQTQTSENVAHFDQKLQEVQRVHAAKQARLREEHAASEAELERALETERVRVLSMAEQRYQVRYLAGVFDKVVLHTGRLRRALIGACTETDVLM